MADEASPITAIGAELLRRHKLNVELTRDETAIAPRLVVDDATSERIASLLIQQGGRIAALAPEGDLFDLIAGKYSGAPSLGVFLRAHAGEDLRVDRVGRPAEYVSAAAVTLGLCLQPEVLAGLADKPGFRGRGLLGRILFSLPENTVGRRAINPPAVPEVVARTYETRIGRLLRRMTEPAWTVEREPETLRLSPKAQARLIAFETALEPRLGEFGDLGPISDWAGKLTGATARIAALLHLAEHGDEAAPWAIAVEEATMIGAIAVAEYLLAHAQAAFGLMGADPTVEAARHVARWLIRVGVERISKRDLFQGVKGRFKRMDALEAPLALLVHHRYLLPEEPETERAGPGRSPSPGFRVHPDLAA
jgi:replicative DNA helicase